MAPQSEGVIKFEAAHQVRPLDSRRVGDLAVRLIAWRRLLAAARLVGRDPTLYEGAAYGNLSHRTGAPSDARGCRAFLITGSQTAGKQEVTLADFAIVERYDYRRNRLASHGPCRPSSESMTHAALYDEAPEVRAVLHAHSPDLWRRARALRLPTTDAGISYGSPEMALAVQRLYREGVLPERRILAMGGHEDGIVAFGRTVEEAGGTLFAWLAKAYEAEGRETNGRELPPSWNGP